VLAAQEAFDELIGKQGIALTPLRPAGKMETDDGKLVDVVAAGAFVERGTRIVVRECKEGRVRVLPADGS
jgi:membrane-bound serine protease (ClpP class)